MGKQNETRKETNIIKEMLELIACVVVAFSITWGVLTFVGERTNVKGSSMYATLEDGDDLWIDKLSYRLKDPERFDIVVFPHEEGNDSVYYIKRIIGLPGERIRIEEDGTIYINNEPLEEEYGYETIEPYTIGRAKSNLILGEDEYFVMGDNRNDSLDSRDETVGNIKREDLVGKTKLRVGPLNKFGLLD